jgi:hypothetical protein
LALAALRRPQSAPRLRLVPPLPLRLVPPPLVRCLLALSVGRRRQ